MNDNSFDDIIKKLDELTKSIGAITKTFNQNQIKPNPDLAIIERRKDNLHQKNKYISETIKNQNSLINELNIKLANAKTYLSDLTSRQKEIQNKLDELEHNSNSRFNESDIKNAFNVICDYCDCDSYSQIELQDAYDSFKKIIYGTCDDAQFFGYDWNLDDIINVLTDCDEFHLADKFKSIQ